MNSIALSQHLLEAVDPDAIDPQSYVDQLYTSDVPGYRVKPGKVKGTWDVYRDIGGTAKFEHVGTITYDPQDHMPPEAVSVWKDIHWWANAGWRDQDQDLFKTFMEAFHYIVKRAQVRAGLPESAQPDEFDLENYVKTTQPGEAALRAGLRQFYDYVGIHTRPSVFSNQVTWTSRPVFSNQVTWIVTCRRSKAMPLPADLRYDGGGKRFKNLVRCWLSNWAADSGLYLLPGTEFFGRLRSNVTIQLNTASPGGGKNMESLEPEDDPERYFNNFVKYHNWQNQLIEWMRAFDPLGTFYTIPYGDEKQHAVIINVTTYFPPEGTETHPDYQRRLCEFVRKKVGENLFPVKSLNSWKFVQSDIEGYVWIILNIPDFTPKSGTPPNVTWKAN